MSVAILFHRADKQSMPDVVIQEPLSTSPPSTSRRSTKDIPVQGLLGDRQEGSSLVSSSAEEPAESFCNSDLPPQTSSSLPQLSGPRPTFSRAAAAARRRCNLSLGSLAGRVPRAWKRSQNNGRYGRDSEPSSSTVVTGAVDGQTPADDGQNNVASNNPMGDKKPSGSFSGTRLDRTSNTTSELERNQTTVALGRRRYLEFRGEGQQVPRTVNKKRLLQVGVAWSRSQEFQPRKFHHDVLGFSKLVSRRKSYHCVYSENIGSENNGPQFL